MTIKDAGGREWVLVPREATDEMVASGGFHCIQGAGAVSAVDKKQAAKVYAACIAAAPQFVPPAVTDEVGQRVRDAAAAPELVEALGALIDAADTSDDCQYGTLATWFVRNICSAALAKAGVAPCAQSRTGNHLPKRMEAITSTPPSGTHSTGSDPRPGARCARPPACGRTSRAGA